jgi:hypothetical protein
LRELAYGLHSEHVPANQLFRLLARSSVTTNHLHGAYSLIFEGDYVVTVPPDVGRRRIWAQEGAQLHRLRLRKLAL